MNDDPVDELWQADARVRSKMSHANPEIASLAYAGLRLIKFALQRGAMRDLAPADLVKRYAAAQATASLRSAVATAFGGYPVQALALSRLATEYVLLCWYMEKMPEEGPDWLDFDAAPPKSAGDIAKVVFAAEPESSDQFHQMRKLFHRFAHLDTLGLASVMKGVENDEAVVLLGSDDDPRKLAVSMYYVLTVMGLLVDTLARWAPSSRSATEPWLRAVESWRTRLEDRADFDLEQTGLRSDEGGLLST